MVPSYNYLSKKDKSIVKDLKKKYKKQLGDKKDFDGWNFGYRCLPSTTIVNNLYGQPVPIQSVA